MRQGYKRKATNQKPKWRPVPPNQYRKIVARERAAVRRSLGAARRFRLNNIRTGGLLGVETKFLDMALSPTALPNSVDWTATEFDPTSGCTGCLSCPAQGDGASNRDGLKFIAKSIEIEGSILIDAQTAQTTADIAPEILIVLYVDTQTNAAQSQGEDVYSSLAAGSFTATHPLRNMTNGTRFKVLKKKMYRGQMPSLVNVGATPAVFVQSGYTIPFKMFVKLDNMHMRCSTGGTTANVNTVIDNSLHLIANCNSTGQAPQITYNARLRFVG